MPSRSQSGAGRRRAAKPKAIYVGTAGWSISKDVQAEFSGPGTHLMRYAERFRAVEINSSFHKPHRPQTYAKWADAVPAGFRFAVKMPREISHKRKLVDVDEPLDAFLAQIAMLGDGLGPLLLQLPPSLAFDPRVAIPFFKLLRKRSTGFVACEPRHATWFSAPANATLIDFKIARVAADPAVVPEAAIPGGWTKLTYRRLHGSPRMYYSAYEAEQIARLAADMTAAKGDENWCIFDNTTLGAGTPNALQLLDRVTAR